MENKVEIGNCILYLGDCYDILKEIDDNSVTLVHSDPPYVVHSGSQKSEWYENIGVNKQLDKLKTADISDGFDMQLVMTELERICKCPNYQLWCSKKQFPELLNYAIEKGYSWQDIMLYRNNALIEGAKPVVVFPYTDIVEMARISMRNFSQKYADYKFRTSANSTEAYEDVISDYHSREHRLIPNFNDPKYKIMSTESVDGEEKIKFNVKNYTDLRDSVIDKFVSKEDLNEYMARGIEDVSNNIERVRNERLFDIYGSNVINKAEKVNEVNEKFREFQDKVKVDGSLSEHFKEQIFNAVKTIDSNIEFYDQSELAMGVSINNFRRLMQMSF